MAMILAPDTAGGHVSVPSAAAVVGVWESVMEATRKGQERNEDPFLWAIQVSSGMSSAGLELPSVELAELLVSHICWGNNVPLMWKFLDKAMGVGIVDPWLVLALLSKRVVPCRHIHPAAYRLYMELLMRHGFSSKSEMRGFNYENFGIQATEPGLLVVLFVFYTVWQLLDATLDDEGLLELVQDKKSRWPTKTQDMEIDDHERFHEKRIEQHVAMHRMNTVIAIEILGKFLQDRVTSRILYLARRNLPSDWAFFIQGLQLLALKSSSIRNSKFITPETLIQLTLDTSKALPRECETSLHQEFHAIMASGSLIPSVRQSHGASRSALWVPIDLFLEDAMDGLIVTAASAVDTLTDLVKSLQAVNGTTWQDTFLGLYIAVLRLIQRDRDPSEGPVPRLDTCLCMLLSITTLAVLNIIDEEESALNENSGCSSTNQRNDNKVLGSRRSELVASLQLMGECEGLLTPPLTVASVANKAAAKAMMYLSGINIGSGFLDSISMNEMPVTCSGNMRHLIVEACIARNLLDTSAYMWPGYVNIRSNQIPRGVPGQVPGWSSVMKGAPLTLPLVHAIVATPASSLVEVEKDHVVLFITRLLSPPRPMDYSGSDSHLIAYGPFLNVVLVGISTVDILQIFSLHGLVPQLAGALMPICEAFGSCSPKISWASTQEQDINSHTVFSNAFTLLLMLWRFDHPPVEHVMGGVPPVGSQLTPEYLLAVRNSQLASTVNMEYRNRNRRLSNLLNPSHAEPIFMSAFPKLKRWYRQHQACIASALSVLDPGNPVHQLVDGLLNMLFKKISRGNQTTSSGSSSSSSSAIEEGSLRLQLPAWDILEVVPFVLEAALTAVCHDKLSPRELATGLKDLVDFLPGSLASILSYFSAEVTRGVWKPASMNGTDWPSPAANLSTVEQQIKKLLAATGIDVPSLDTARSSTPTLPLPLAALLSLTITYKLDKASERYLNLAGRAVIMLSASCPWPCLPIVAALWAQKVKRWSDFLIFSASRTVFHHDDGAVVQLLRCCFSSTLGLNPSPCLSSGGVSALLGHGFGSHLSGGMSAVAPGIFYLRIYPFIRDPMFTAEAIFSLLMMSVRDIAGSGLPQEGLEKLKKTKYNYGQRYGQASMAASMTRVKLVASLGATMVWITGGLNLVQALISQMLPAWFISQNRLEGSDSGEAGRKVAMLGGYVMAYFVVYCGAFAWGVDAAPSGMAKRAKVLGKHLKFMAMALDGKILLGCDLAMWQAYVSGFVSLMVGCMPAWIVEVDVSVLKSLSNGSRHWNEEELALGLLGAGGIQAVGAAAEILIHSAV
ncbi:Mediator of RNA polymerase II transcription subunit 33A-like protein [Drosera capensis]